MHGHMGLFHVRVEVENLTRDRKVLLEHVMVDTGAEYSWVPAQVLDALGVQREKVMRFRMADGTIIARDMGFVILYVRGRFTADDVVFGDLDDLPLLGARTIEGLNFKVDLAKKELVHGGPVITASAA